VYEDEKISRTIAIDKMRKIKFVMTAAGTDANDPNAMAGGQTREKTDGETPQRPGQPGSKTSERGPRTTDGRTPQRTNEPMPYKPVQPVPERTVRRR
jgi:hypothetical protein